MWCPIGGGTPRQMTPGCARRIGTDGRRMARRWRLPVSAMASSIFTPSQLRAARRRGSRRPRDSTTGRSIRPTAQYIYFNSERTGHMQIWRMKADGSAQEQVTYGRDQRLVPAYLARWTVDGRFVAYEKDVTGHPAEKDVTLHADVDGGQEGACAGQALRRAGNHQCAVVVARQQEACVRQLRSRCPKRA